jgi:RNA polymerase sigma factor (sigma-70 family)
LDEFASSQSPGAFAELVRRYVDLVYTTARRLVGDPHLAEDVTQAVFIVLAKKAPQVNAEHLPGWLVVTTRLAARQAMRTDRTRQKHERQAAAMRPETAATDEPTAEHLRPLLDDALAELYDTDRTAVVRRFLLGQSFAEVGAGMGISEEAARKRVGRAVEKLRTIFVKRGITPSAGGLMVVLAAQPAQAAPATLAAAVTAPTAGAALIAKGVVATFASVAFKIELIVAAIILVGGASVALIKTLTDAPLVQGPSSAVPARLPAVANDNLAGVIDGGDLIEVVLADIFQPGVADPIHLRVDDLGSAFLPLIGQVRVAGLTTDVAASRVSQAYTRANIAKDSVVTVAIRERKANATAAPGPVAVGETVTATMMGLNGSNKVTQLRRTVAADGTIDLPDIGKVTIAGRTADVAAGDIKDAQRQKGIQDRLLITLLRGEPPPPLKPIVFQVQVGEPVKINTPDTPIAVGDVVEVSVDDLVAPNVRSAMPSRVEASGNIPVVLIGDIKVAGLKPGEAAAAVAKGYRDAKIIQFPQVAVNVVEPAAQSKVKPGPFGVGDTARILLMDLTSPGSTTTVHAQVAGGGTIELPLVGQVNIRGLTESEATRVIAQRYSDAKIIDKMAAAVLRTSVAMP